MNPADNVPVYAAQEAGGGNLIIRQCALSNPVETTVPAFGTVMARWRDQSYHTGNFLVGGSPWESFGGLGHLRLYYISALLSVYFGNYPSSGFVTVSILNGNSSLQTVVPYEAFTHIISWVDIAVSGVLLSNPGGVPAHVEVRNRCNQPLLFNNTVRNIFYIRDFSP